MAERNRALYASHSHQELYQMVRAGRPDQIDGQAATWRSLHEAVDHLSTTLARDLDELGHAWQSSSGQEYARRLGLVVSYSGRIATDFSQLQQSLTDLAATLREAQKHAEDPAQTDNNQHMKEDAAKGAAVGSVFGPVGTLTGALIGGSLGHNQDEEAQQQAHERMITLVANLAGQYQVTQDNWPLPPTPPDDMPDDGSGGQANPSSGPGGRSAHGVHQIGSVHSADAHSPAPSGTTPATLDSNSALLSAGDAVLGSLALNTTGLDALRGGPATLGTGAAGAPTPADGVIGARNGGGQQRGTGAAGASGGRPSAGGTGSGSAGGAHRAAMGTNSANRTGMTAQRGEGTEDEPAEHLTWLIEDQMVWGGDDPSAPAVLGVDETEPDRSPAQP